MASSYSTLLQLDAALTKAGIPPLTKFWSEQAQKFYGHPTAKTLVARVGRSGAKSHTTAKLGLNEILYGDFDVPLGERHYFGYVSLNKDEATQRLTLLKDFLTALGVKFDAYGDEIALRSSRLGFKVFANQISSVSGWRAIGFAIDEYAKFKSGSEYANEGKEIFTSLAAMAITHENARRLLVSSPWGLDDAHAVAFARGDTDDQVVCWAPSWVANPDRITEERARVGAPDFRTFQREYEALPGAIEDGAFDLQEIQDAFTTKGEVDGPSFCLVDPSAGLHDHFAYGIAAPTKAGGVVLLHVDGFSAEQVQAVGGLGGVIDKIARTCTAYKVKKLYGDQYDAELLKMCFKNKGLSYTSYPYTERSKEEAVRLLGRLLQGRLLALPQHERLAKDMRALRARLQPTGFTSYNSNGLDYVSLLITMGHAITARAISVKGALPAKTTWDSISIGGIAKVLGAFNAADGGPNMYEMWHQEMSQQSNDSPGRLPWQLGKVGGALGFHDHSRGGR